MKTTSVPLWLLAATLIAAPSMAQDKSAKADAPPVIRDWSPAALLERYDKNKDGKIDDAEKAVALKDRRMMSEMGYDLSTREKRKEAKARQAEALAKMEQSAKNAGAAEARKMDPVMLGMEDLSAAEKAKLRQEKVMDEVDKAEALSMRMRDPDARRAALIKRFDADGDGELNIEEKAAVGDFLLKQMERRKDGTPK